MKISKKKVASERRLKDEHQKYCYALRNRYKSASYIPKRQFPFNSRSCTRPYVISYLSHFLSPLFFLLSFSARVCESSESAHVSDSSSLSLYTDLYLALSPSLAIRAERQPWPLRFQTRSIEALF